MQDEKNLPYVNFIYLLFTPNVLINELILWVTPVMYQIFEYQYSIKEYGLIILLCYRYIKPVFEIEQRGRMAIIAQF